MSDRCSLERVATQLLRKAGYTWAGRDRRAVVPHQHAFERRMVRVPTLGKSRRRA